LVNLLDKLDLNRVEYGRLKAEEAVAIYKIDLIKSMIREKSSELSSLKKELEDAIWLQDF